MGSVAELIEAEDVDALLRLVDSRVSSREWEELERLGEACRRAVERGRQLWSVATHADYRLALDAPAPFVARALARPVSRFTMGPLTEVAAARHTWEDLAGLLADPPAAAAFAQERILRGEDLRGDVRAQPDMFELPLVRAQAEVAVEGLVPTYEADRLHVPDPLPPAAVATLGRVDACVADAAAMPEARPVWNDLFDIWTSQSGGDVRIATTRHGVECAVSLLAPDAHVGVLTAGDALVRLEWAAATGAAHARRPGFAVGRFGGWWAAARLASVVWPFAGTADAFVDEALTACEWMWFEPVPRPPGWVFGLAAARSGGCATAVLARDAKGGVT
ncbi:MAG: hypothetical protein IT198_14475 [Acidimicrobiia bacterium]|nr:hypothetical protein [Acidimicrobiia bacterium]